MSRQFQAIVRNTITHQEWTFEANSAAVAASRGAERVKAEALKGFWVQMVIANLGTDDLSHATSGQVVKG